MDASKAGLGHRVYEIRRVLGPNPRREMPQREFATRLNELAAAVFPADDRPSYDSSVITRIESGQRWATVQDVTLVSMLDPHHRGKLWLAWGEKTDASVRPARTFKDVAAAFPDAPREREHEAASAPHTQTATAKGGRATGTTGKKKP